LKCMNKMIERTRTQTNVMIEMNEAISKIGRQRFRERFREREREREHEHKHKHGWCMYVLCENVRKNTK